MREYYSILLTLADGAWCRSSDLRARSGLGQADLMACLRQFETDGLVFEWSDDTRLRWLNPSKPLSADEILSGLARGARGFLNRLEVYYELESTSGYLQESGFPHAQVCLAEKQLAGRGRLGRHWHSPACANIYLSLGWRFETTSSRLAGLSLGVGVKLAEALEPLAAVGLKWPNDLYINDRKLGGVLIELKPLPSGGTGVVVGIGINVAMQDPGADIDQPWTSLQRHCQPRESIERNGLVSRILDQLVPFLEEYRDNGDDYIFRRWPEYDLAYQQRVSVHSGGEIMAGVGAGIDRKFQFRLRHERGISSFSSAQVSLRL